MSAEKPRLALITGGCKRVGAAIAARLAREGWSLALHGHSDTEPDAALSEIIAQTGTDWHGFLADFDQPEACASLIDEVAGYFGRGPDLLVNNASLFAYDDVDSLTAKNLHAHFAVNIHAPVLLTQKLVEMATTAPCVVNITDQRVRNPNGDQLSYSLSKQALSQATRTLAIAYGSRARINAVAPGLTLATEDFTPDQIAKLHDMMPLGLCANPSDIAEAVHYLACARAVTGQTIYVDGGAHLTHYERDFLFLGK